MNVEQARFNMIEQQIRPWDVLDPAVLQVLGVVKREDFVPAQHRSLAFVDTQVPLTAAGARGPVMLEPKVEARLLQELQIKHHERVLEIGAGSGFMAALLAHVSHDVTTVDSDPGMAALARGNLASAGLSRVKVLTEDGAQFKGEAESFDVVVLSGSVAELPKSLLALLRPGGRLIAIVGDWPIMRARMVTRSASGEGWTEVDLFDTVAPRLSGFPEPSRFRF